MTNEPEFFQLLWFHPWASKYLPQASYNFLATEKCFLYLFIAVRGSTFQASRCLQNFKLIQNPLKSDKQNVHIVLFLLFTSRCILLNCNLWRIFRVAFSVGNFQFSCKHYCDSEENEKVCVLRKIISSNDMSEYKHKHQVNKNSHLWVWWGHKVKQSK